MSLASKKPLPAPAPRRFVTLLRKPGPMEQGAFRISRPDRGTADDYRLTEHGDCGMQGRWFVAERECASEFDPAEPVAVFLSVSGHSDYAVPGSAEANDVLDALRCLLRRGDL